MIAILFILVMMLVGIPLLVIHGHWVWAIIVAFLGLHAIDTKIQRARGWDPELDDGSWHYHEQYYEENNGQWIPTDYRRPQGPPPGQWQGPIPPPPSNWGG